MVSGEIFATDGTHQVDAGVNNDGTFQLDVHSLGDYRIFVNPFTEGAVGKWIGGTSYEAARIFSASTNVDLGDISGVDPTTTSVVLTDMNNRPLNDGAALLLDAAGHEVDAARVDDSGKVTLTAPPGTYRLLAGSPTTQPVDIPLDATSSRTIPIALAPGASINAKITDKDGNPLPAVVVALYSGDKVIASGATDEQGTYSFFGMDPGRSRLPQRVRLHPLLRIRR